MGILRFIVMAPVFMALGIGAGGMDACAFLFAVVASGFFSTLPGADAVPCRRCGGDVFGMWCAVCGGEAR